ncbi:VOC family protein [Xanthovirga aplysinae]|uniref:VOC family protein n=1 Tax=Xanthovirga aplysinae TaxID=2529853 RepID=UPI0012BBD7C0|nr:VOC family protein [Xanthovirga aplysinae]MTI29606.1 glyoxalase [Xanthovirga aplysinae]
MSKINPFHLAMPVHDLEKARKFYGKVLGCKEGRSDEHWIDFNFFGHQFVTHLKEGMKVELHTNQVDGHGVPVPHFGVVLEMEDWKALAERLKAQEIQFAIEPYIRFKGEVGEQATMFFYDPSGNSLEFKAFKNKDQLFAK